MAAMSDQLRSVSLLESPAFPSLKSSIGYRHCLQIGDKLAVYLVDIVIGNFADEDQIYGLTHLLITFRNQLSRVSVALN
jgi:hypothetical protein